MASIMIIWCTQQIYFAHKKAVYNSYMEGQKKSKSSGKTASTDQGDDEDSDSGTLTKEASVEISRSDTSENSA